jgi:hypothetical protein
LADARRILPLAPVMVLLDRAAWAHSYKCGAMEQDKPQNRLKIGLHRRVTRLNLGVAFREAHGPRKGLSPLELRFLST